MKGGKIELYEYQAAAERLAWAALRKAHRRVLLTMPTGSGKTVVAVHMMLTWRRRGARILFISHRREHINQLYVTALAWGLAQEELSVIIGKQDPRENPDAPIQIASKDTLIRRKIKPKADVVIVDEAHHAVAKTYAALQTVYLSSVWLGLTATPYRLDGRGLAAAFDVLIIGAKPSELIAIRAMAKPRVFTAPLTQRAKLAATLKEVSTIAGDYSPKELARVVRKHSRMLVGDLPSHKKRYAPNLPTVVYVVNLRHARLTVAAFEKAGYRVGLITGKTSVDDRERMIGGPRGWKESQLARGEIDVVVNCNVLVEGWDCPPARCVMIARPTKSLALWIHACGRALRKGRRRPIILDHAGNALRAGIRCLPHEDLEFSLENGVGRRTGRNAPKGPKACPVCTELAPRGAEVCENPECGHVFVQVPEQVEGKLVELTEDQVVEILKKERERLRKLVAQKVIPSAVVAPFLKAKANVLRRPGGGPVAHGP